MILNTIKGVVVEDAKEWNYWKWSEKSLRLLCFKIELKSGCLWQFRSTTNFISLRVLRMHTSLKNFLPKARSIIIGKAASFVESLLDNWCGRLVIKFMVVWARFEVEIATLTFWWALQKCSHLTLTSHNPLNREELKFWQWLIERHASILTSKDMCLMHLSKNWDCKQ